MYSCHPPRSQRVQKSALPFSYRKTPIDIIHRLPREPGSSQATHTAHPTPLPRLIRICKVYRRRDATAGHGADVAVAPPYEAGMGAPVVHPLAALSCRRVRLDVVQHVAKRHQLHMHTMSYMSIPMACTEGLGARHGVTARADECSSNRGRAHALGRAPHSHDWSWSLPSHAVPCFCSV